MKFLEKFSIANLGELVEHSQSINWYTKEDWLCFLDNGAVFGHRIHGKIVSSAFLANYDGDLSWLGAFIVNPGYQGRGPGKELLQHCLSKCDTVHSVLGLVSTEEGKALYESAGFKTVSYTHKFTSEKKFDVQLNLRLSQYKIRELTEGDLPEVIRLDSHAVGATRTHLLQHQMRRSKLNFGAVDNDGKLVGFIFGTKDGTRTLLGPLVATNSAAARQLVHELFCATDGCARIDIPHWQADFCQWFKDSGFTLERICPVMTYEGRPLPRQSDFYFGLMAQALG